MLDPCLPALHSPATLRAWSVWGRAHSWWKPAAIVVGCAAAVGAPVAVFYPYAKATPVIVAPVLAPLPSAGSAGQGFYVPPREGSEFSPYLPGTPEHPTSVTQLSNIGVTPVAVPEPASLALLAVGAGGAVLVRRRRGA